MGVLKEQFTATTAATDGVVWARGFTFSAEIRERGGGSKTAQLYEQRCLHTLGPGQLRVEGSKCDADGLGTVDRRLEVKTKSSC